VTSIAPAFAFSGVPALPVQELDYLHERVGVCSNSFDVGLELSMPIGG
jgi:hypothetical protein